MRIKELIICFLCCATLSTFAQEKLKKVTDKDKATGITEIYFVKEKAEMIKQGEYKQFGPGNSLFVSGKFNNNQRTGVWTFYRRPGEISREFDFDKDSLISYNRDKNDSVIFRVRTANGWEKKEVSSPPFPLYGDLTFILNHELKYPATAKQTRISGIVVVSVHINKTGAVLGCRIYKDVDQRLDREALRVINNVAVWYPAICEGKTVECEYLIPVSYVLK
jgi:TonB family protein